MARMKTLILSCVSALFAVGYGMGEDMTPMNIARSLDSSRSGLRSLEVHYRVEVQQLMAADEIPKRDGPTSESQGRLGPMATVVDCVWAARYPEGKEFFETTEYYPGGRKLHQRRMIERNQTTVWTERLTPNDYDRVVITKTWGGGQRRDLRYARFWLEDYNERRALTDVLTTDQWLFSGSETNGTKNLQRFRKTHSSAANSYDELSFDAKRKFALAAVRNIWEGRDVIRWNVEEFASFNDGILWLPRAINMETFLTTGEPLASYRIIVQDITVNDGVSDSLFTLSWNDGTLVHDEVSGKDHWEGGIKTPGAKVPAK